MYNVGLPRSSEVPCPRTRAARSLALQGSPFIFGGERESQEPGRRGWEEEEEEEWERESGREREQKLVGASRIFSPVIVMLSKHRQTSCCLASERTRGRAKDGWHTHKATHNHTGGHGVLVSELRWEAGSPVFKKGNVSKTSLSKACS